MAQFFGLSSFSNIKKSILACLFFFSNIKKAYLQILKRPREFFRLFPFSYIKNSELKNLKKTEPNLLTYLLFQILKKVYLQILEKAVTICFLVAFLKY